MNVDNVTVISEAVPNLKPISPNNVLNVVIGLVLGGMIGVGLAFLLEFLDNTVKDEKFIVENLGWTSLGRISEMTADELKSDGRQNLPQRSADTKNVRSRV
ncbi:MAG: GNVR domain-containing protein [Alkalibacterium sp.]|nr:GNVR domain-containing protein [Alkalibacterium sp.]